MRAYAQKFSSDEELWGIVGLLHDFDYERFPNADHSATEGHPAEGVRLLAGQGFPEPMQRAILALAALRSVFRNEDFTGSSRALWVVLILVFPLFGSLIYFGVRGDW